MPDYNAGMAPTSLSGTSNPIQPSDLRPICLCWKGRNVEKRWGYCRVSASLLVCPGLPALSYPAGALLGQDGGGEGL